MKRLIPLLLLLPLAANAVIISKTLSQNGDGTTHAGLRTTIYPSGNAPVTGGASCSTWTCAQKGDGDGEIDEVSSTELDFTANSSDTSSDFDYAYQTCADTGDCQAKVRRVASTGYSENFTAFGVGITESTLDTAKFWQCWWPDVGQARFNYGSGDTVTATAIGTVTTLPEYLMIEYDQSASEIRCFHSDDDATWTEVGTAISDTLSCSGGNCLGYVFGTSSLLGESSFASLTHASVSTTITDPGGGGGGNEDNLLWAGDFRNNDFRQWHLEGQVGTTGLAGIPSYCRPNINYGSFPAGDGSCLSLVTSTSVSGLPTAISDKFTYMAKYTVKNSANGSEVGSQDCNTQPPDCNRRRTELEVQGALPTDYGAMLRDQEFWYGFHITLPSNYSTNAGGWGPIVRQIKDESGVGSPVFAITAKDTTWQIDFIGDPVSPVEPGNQPGNQHWSRRMLYCNGCPDGGGLEYPRTSSWPDGLNDLPNTANSMTALGSVATGDTTCWVANIVFDGDTPAASNSGKIDLWKKEMSGHGWIKVLEIRAQDSHQRGGQTWNRPVGWGGTRHYGLRGGFYSSKSAVWNEPQNVEYYGGGDRVFDGNATFADVSCDGSAP